MHDFRGPTRNSMLGFLIVMFALFALTGLLVVVWDKVTTDEARTCRIQATGLPASHELADVIGDIHKLLTLPPSPQARKQPPLPKATAELIRDLNTNARLYSTTEAQQPKTRSC